MITLVESANSSPYLSYDSDNVYVWGDYVYTMGNGQRTRIYNRTSAAKVLDSDNFPVDFSNMWGGYLAQSGYTGFRLISFNGSSITIHFSKSSDFISSAGIALNGSYVVVYNDGNYVVYNYSGTQVSTLGSTLVPMYLRAVKGGQYIYSVGPISDGYYLAVFSINSSGVMALIDSIKITSGLNTPGYPYWKDDGSDIIYIGYPTNNLMMIHFDGYELSVIDAFGVGSIYFSFMGEYGDFLFVKRAQNYLGLPPYSLHAMSFSNSMIVQNFGNYNEAFGLTVDQLYDKVYISGGETGAYGLTKYDASWTSYGPAVYSDTFNAQWL